MLDGPLTSWLTVMMTIFGIALLGAVLAYGVLMWRRRSHDPVIEHARDESTERLYRDSEREEKNQRI